jgi:hypothetical protein
MLTTPIKANSAIEKRRLSTLPEWTADTTLQGFRTEVENFLNDQVGFREELIESRSILSYFVLNTSTNDRVIIGSDGWLFYNTPHGPRDRIRYRVIDDYYRVATPTLTEQQLEAFLRQVEARRDLFADYGITYYFVITPDKHSIYPNRLPDAYTPLAEDNWLDQTMAYMDEHYDGDIIDLRDPVRLAAEESTALLYYPQGTHWTSDGAWVGYQTIMERIAQDFPNVGTVERDLFAPSEGEGDRDLALFIGLRNYIEPLPRYDEAISPCAVSIETEGQGKSLGIKERRPDGEDFLYFQCDDAPSPYTIAFARNSFTIALQHFFSETFTTAAYDWGSNYSDTAARNMVEQIQPDIFIDQWVERNLINTFSDIISEEQS